MINFEVCSKYVDQDIKLPIRKTESSAGYDFFVAEDTVIPSYKDHMANFVSAANSSAETDKGFYLNGPLTLDQVGNLTKKSGAKPTLVSTGIKCQLESNQYLELSVRSSCPLKYWLILANGVGIIDADYYNNESNEGLIYFQLINLLPYPILLKKGDAIGQGIIKNYLTTDKDNVLSKKRVGGFGSTDG